MVADPILSKKKAPRSTRGRGLLESLMRIGRDTYRYRHSLPLGELPRADLAVAYLVPDFENCVSFRFSFFQNGNKGIIRTSPQIVSLAIGAYDFIKSIIIITQEPLVLAESFISPLLIKWLNVPLVYPLSFAHLFLLSIKCHSKSSFCLKIYT